MTTSWNPGSMKSGPTLNPWTASPASERFQQPEGNGGLTYPARHSRDHDDARRLHARTLPSAEVGCKGRVIVLSKHSNRGATPIHGDDRARDVAGAG